MSLSVCTIWWIYIKLDFTFATPCTEEAVIEDDDDYITYCGAILLEFESAPLSEDTYFVHLLKFTVSVFLLHEARRCCSLCAYCAVKQAAVLRWLPIQATRQFITLWHCVASWLWWIDPCDNLTMWQIDRKNAWWHTDSAKWIKTVGCILKHTSHNALHADVNETKANKFTCVLMQTIKQ